jgi:hypothetical protein
MRRSGTERGDAPRWLYLAVGCMASVVITLTVVVIAAPGRDGGSDDTASDVAGEGAQEAEVSPEIGEVEQAVVAFRRALQGQGNPCELMTPGGRQALYQDVFGIGPEPITPDGECVDQARTTGTYQWKRQREVPADSETAVVVQDSQAAAAEVVGGMQGFESLFLVNTQGRWLIAGPEEVSAQALEEALERGEGQ